MLSVFDHWNICCVFAMSVCVPSHFSRVQLFVILWTIAHQAPLSMGFSRQEYWSEFPCSPPGNLPDPGIESKSLMSPALAGRFFNTSATWEILGVVYGLYYVEICSCSSYFLESFYHRWVSNFVKSFLYIYWDDHMVFIFQFVNMMYHIDWFRYIEESLHPWDESHLIMIYDPPNALLDSLC